MPKYEDIYVGIDLSSPGGNAFAIVASVSSGLKSYGVSREDIEKFRREALSGTYGHLLNVCQQWVDFEYWNEGDIEYYE